MHQQSSVIKKPAGTSPHCVRLQSGGFSLVELLISMTLGLFIISVVIMALMTASSGAKTNERTSQLQMDVQNTLQIIKREVLHAGFTGLSMLEAASANTGTIIAECAPGFVANFRQGIWGANNSNPFAGSCIPAARYSANTDILAVRHLGMTPVALNDLEASTVYFVSAYSCGQVFVGTVPPPCNDPLITYYPIESSVYFISPCTDDPCEPNPRPALYRARLNNGLSMANQELLVSGVENMQIQYGREVNGNIQFFDASDLTGSSTTTVPTDWDEIQTIRIWLLIRNRLPEIGYTNNQTYVLGKNKITVNDSYRRQVISTVVQLRNQTSKS